MAERAPAGWLEAARQVAGLRHRKLAERIAAAVYRHHRDNVTARLNQPMPVDPADVANSNGMLFVMRVGPVNWNTTVRIYALIDRNGGVGVVPVQITLHYPPDQEPTPPGGCV